MYFSSLSKLASIFQNSFTNTSRHLRSKLHHSSNLKISGLDNNKWTRCFSIKSQDESVCPVELSESIVRITPSLESADVSIIKVPQIGKNLKKFKLHQWFKKPGDYVKSGEILCIIETEKIFGKVYSQLSGIVIENVCKEGCSIVAGADLAILLQGDNELPIYNPYQISDGMINVDGRRKFSTLSKYKPMISFGTKHVAKEITKLSETVEPSGTKKLGSGPQVNFIEDFINSPYKHWVRSISKEEIDIINHGIAEFSK